MIVEASCEGKEGGEQGGLGPDLQVTLASHSVRLLRPVQGDRGQDQEAGGKETGGEIASEEGRQDNNL